MSMARGSQLPAHTNLSTNVQKLESYSDTMVALAASKEKAGQMNEAASYYLKAADILLVACRDPGIGYTEWVKLSEKASTYHQRVRAILVKHQSEIHST